MTDPAPPDAAPDPALSPDISAHVVRMQGYLDTLSLIGTPDALAAIEALDAAMTGMSAALQLAAAAMIAATPTSH